MKKIIRMKNEVEIIFDINENISKEELEELEKDVFKPFAKHIEVAIAKQNYEMKQVESLSGEDYEIKCNVYTDYEIKDE